MLAVVVVVRVVEALKKTRKEITWQMQIWTTGHMTGET
jgi:hypothetical protein